MTCTSSPAPTPSLALASCCWFEAADPRQADLSVDNDERVAQIRIPAGVVERFDLTGIQPERVIEAFSALSVVSEVQ